MDVSRVNNTTPTTYSINSQNNRIHNKQNSSHISDFIHDDSAKLMANALRILIVDMIEYAQSGHPGLPLGMADVVTILYKYFIKFLPSAPQWDGRDRFILSAGHGSALLYALLYLLGYSDISIDDLKKFRQLHSKTPGHPEYKTLSGVEVSTGPLGQGVANAVGIALNSKMMTARKNCPESKVYVLASDGCLMEGITHEAISLAGHLCLDNLIMLFDDNGISIDGPTSLTTSEDHMQRFLACGWSVRSISGHDYTEIYAALEWAQEQKTPCMIACKTVIGYGAPNKSGTSMIHGSPLGPAEAKALRNFLNCDNVPPFDVPNNILLKWRELGDRCYHLFSVEELIAPVSETKIFPDIETTTEKEATRQSFGRIIKEYTKYMPFLIGGSADLTPSNNTATTNHSVINKHSFEGNYIHYGIREHAMAAIMNGIALCGNFIPYGGTFLVFTDYMRPAIRMAALMKLRVILIATHDSVWLGEDGPTHQPIEHLAALRAIPHLRVFRPCNARETKACLDEALQYSGPSIIALTRQPVSQQEHSNTHNSRIMIYASGSEVELAIEVQAGLRALDIAANIVSVPELEKLQYIKGEYINIVIEAGIRMGWDERIPNIQCFIGLRDFGASGKIEDLKEYFGFVKDQVIQQILSCANF